MNVLLDQNTIIPLLVGAALALLGGLVTQFVFWRASLSHDKQALLSAFRSELKGIRGRLGASLGGYRLSLLQNDPPTPTAFATPTPVFSANVGHLGQLRDNDLVDHIVEVYSNLQALSEQAALYKGISNSAIELRDLNSAHMDATIAHVLVMQLHNRLTNVPPDGRVDIDDFEVESRKHFGENARLLRTGQIGVILGKRWHEA